jgi:hypothetical protein
MAFKKELSKSCRKCGVQWLTDLSNKQPRRALCKGCYYIELEDRSREEREKRAESGALVNRVQLYKDYKFENRKPFWAQINKELKPLKDRSEIRAFIGKQMDRILEDRKLMEYINLKSLDENKYKDE